MGNKSSKKYEPVEPLKFATLNELRAPKDDIPCSCSRLKCFRAYGNTLSEALEELHKICKKYGIPEPTNNPETGKLFCGTVEISYVTKNKKRLNPVFYKERNGSHMFCVYYPRM